MKRGVSMTAELLLLLLFSLVALVAVWQIEQGKYHNIVEHSINAKVYGVFKQSDEYIIKILLENKGTEPVTITQITVEDSKGNKLVFGDHGAIDKVTGEDNFNPITIDGGKSFIIQVTHQVPLSFTLENPVAVLITYKYPRSSTQTLLLASGSFLVSSGYQETNTETPPPNGGGGGSGGGGSGGGGGGTPPSVSYLTVKITANTRKNVTFVPVVIRSDKTDFWSKVSDGSSIYVLDENQQPVQYAIYIDSTDRYGVVWVGVSKTMEKGESLTYYIYYGGSNPHTDKRVSYSWKWQRITNLKNWDIQYVKRYTQEYKYDIYNDHVHVETYWYGWKHYFNVPVLSNYPAVFKGFAVASHEYELSISGYIYIRVIGKDTYKLYFTTCLFRHPEYRLYDSSNRLIYQKELGCVSRNYWGIGILGVTGVPSSTFGLSRIEWRHMYTFTFDKPMDYVKIDFYGGDRGYDNINFYIYAPSLPVFTDGLTVTVS